MGTKIVIDANKLLDFYRAGKHTKAVLLELDSIAEHIVWPNQVVDEFIRNRPETIRVLIKEICSGKLFGVPNTPLLDQLEEAKHLRDALKELSKSRRSLGERLGRILSGEEVDPIAVDFQAILDKGERITLTCGILDRANYRRIRGAPPSSPSRHSAGDEIIFESLLTMRSNVILVTRDNGFLNHEGILAREFKSETNFELSITDDLSGAMKKLGVPSPAIEEAEEDLQREHERNVSAEEVLRNARFDIDGLVEHAIAQHGRDPLDVAAMLDRMLKKEAED